MSRTEKTIDPSSLLKIFERLKSSLHEANKRILNIETKSQKLINSILAIDENKIFDAKMQITVSEAKSDANELSDMISSPQTNDPEEEINLQLSDIPDYRVQLDEKDRVIRQLQKEIRQKQIQTDNSIKKTSKVKPVDVNEQMDIYSLRFQITKLKEQLEQKNYENNEILSELLEKREQLRDMRSTNSSFEDLQSNIKSLTLQKQQADEYASKIGEENYSLKKELSELKMSVSQGTCGSEVLQRQVQNLTTQLEEKDKKLKEYKTKSKQAENELRNHETKMSSMALDSDATNLKTELLIEEITSLKMELADKDNNYTQLKQNTEQSLIKAQSVLSTQKLLENENQLLQKQIADMRKEKQATDQENIKLRVDLDNVRNKIQEKELRSQNDKKQIEDQKEKARALNARLSKYISATREMKQIISEKDGVINELKTKNTNQDNLIKLKRDEIVQLKQQATTIPEVIAENSELKQKQMKSKMEIENLEHKNQLLQQSLDSQIKTNQALSQDLIETRQNASKAHSEYDTLKFDTTKAASQYEAQIRGLQADQQQLHFQLDNAKQETIRQVQDYEARLLEQAADYEGRLKEQQDKYTARIQDSDQQHQSQVADLERRNAIVNRSLNDTLKKVSDLTTENERLTNFKEKVEKIAPPSENTDFVSNLRSLIDTRAAALQQLKSVNKEMKKTEQKYQDLIYDTLKVQKPSGPLTSISLAQEITTALSNANDEIERLNEANAEKEDAIQELQNQLNIANLRDSNVVNAVNQIVSVNGIDDIPVALTRLQEENKAMEQTINQSKTYIECDTNDNLPKAVAKAHADFIALSQEKLKTETELAKRTTELNNAKNENQNLKNQLDTIKQQVSNYVPVESVQNVPAIVKQLKDELEASEQKHETFTGVLCELVDCQSEDDVPEVVRKLKKSYDDVSNSLNTSPENVLSMINNLKKQTEEYNQLMDDISHVDPTITVANAPQVISETKDALHKAEAGHAAFVEQISSITNIHDEKMIPSTIQKLVNDLQDSNTNHAQLVGTLCGHLGVQDEKEINEAVKNIINELSEEKANRTEEKRRHESLVDSIKNIIDVNDEHSIAGAIRELKNTIEDAQELISAIVAVVTHKEKKDVQLVLPLSSQVTGTIQAAIADLVRKYDALQADANQVIESAIQVGYTGKSVVEASEFITETEVRAKAEECREDTFNKLKQVREEGTKERILLEKRNQATNQKLAELRQQKIDLSDQALSKQSELSATIEQLEKKIRLLTNETETIRKVKEELIRLAADEVYDAETLRHNLTESEKLRIHL